MMKYLCRSIRVNTDGPDDSIHKIVVELYCVFRWEVKLSPRVAHHKYDTFVFRVNKFMLTILNYVHFVKDAIISLEDKLVAILHQPHQSDFVFEKNVKS
jgi:hypothetical protein